MLLNWDHISLPAHAISFTDAINQDRQLVNDIFMIHVNGTSKQIDNVSDAFIEV